MLNALIVGEDNIQTCKEVLDLVYIPSRWVEEPTWLIWGDGENQYKGVLPHVVFKDIYNVVGHSEQFMIVERIR